MPSEAGTTEICQGPLPESQGQNLALNVLHVPYSLDSGCLASRSTSLQGAGSTLNPNPRGLESPSGGVSMLRLTASVWGVGRVGGGRCVRTDSALARYLPLTHPRQPATPRAAQSYTKRVSIQKTSVNVYIHRSRHCVTLWRSTLNVETVNPAPQPPSPEPLNVDPELQTLNTEHSTLNSKY